MSLAGCGFAVGTRPSVVLPGIAALPEGALVRTVPNGTLEQVTLRLGVLHALDALGVPVANDARCIERCVDKSMTSFLLDRAGVPTPPTWVVESPERARALAREEARPGRPLVLKPLFGAQGQGLRLVDGPSALPPAGELGGVHYLQAFVGRPEGGWHDWRAFTVGERTVAVMERRGTGWRTNAAQGARCAAAPAGGEIGELAAAAARAVGATHAGVDLIRDTDGRLMVLEVNSMPAWSALQRVSEVDIAAEIVDDLLRRVAAAG